MLDKTGILRKNYFFHSVVVKKSVISLDKKSENQIPSIFVSGQILKLR